MRATIWRINTVFRIFLIGTLIFVFANKVIANPKSISITIDDVPNTTSLKRMERSHDLIDSLNKINIPFSIFINEHNLTKTEYLGQNLTLLESWVSHPNSTLGNHTYSHSRFSDVGIEKFIEDIKKGEVVTEPLARKYNKSLDYFRFPFNDLGKNKEQKLAIHEYLKANEYVVTPFTIESSDWMFDVVYRHYLDKGDLKKAEQVGNLYIEMTLKIIDFYEKTSKELYGRPIRHIYLCHDNALNASYLDDLIVALRDRNYQIESLASSLQDPVYSQENTYTKKWGISWLYRWINDKDKRIELMRKEPALDEIIALYNEIVGE